MRFIGDIHGKWDEYTKILFDPKTGCDDSVQIGDFGVGFFSTEEENQLFDKLNKVGHNHRFIRGNHDSPEACKSSSNWIADGYRHNGVMYVGGAQSIDKHLRTEGVSWWEDEELSYDELGEIVVAYEEYKPEIMVTHDCPDSIARVLFGNVYKNTEANKSRTRQAFNTMFHYTDHRPKIWIFGHWHTSIKRNVMGTDFYCLNELEYIDIDIGRNYEKQV